MEGDAEVHSTTWSYGPPNTTDLLLYPYSPSLYGHKRSGT